MKCYNHQADAVGICKSCSKGICMDCAVDVGNGIACQNSCEQSVKIINEIVDKGSKVNIKPRAIFFRQAFLMGLLGGFFIVFGVVIQKSMANFTVPIGIIFLIWMMFSIFNGRKIKS